MSKAKVTRAAGLRALFNETPREELTMRDVYVRGQITGKDQVGVRNAVRDGVSALVDCGFLVKMGRGRSATFRCSGNGMMSDHRPPAMSREVRLALRRERERLGRSSRHPEVRERHARLLDPPASAAAVPAETVAQFRARGGQIERLSTHWEQMERAA